MLVIMLIGPVTNDYDGEKNTTISMEVFPFRPTHQLINVGEENLKCDTM